MSGTRECSAAAGRPARRIGPMLLGITALTWLVLIPCVACWPIAGYVVYLVHRSGKRHDEREAAERERHLQASQQS